MDTFYVSYNHSIVVSIVLADFIEFKRDLMTAWIYIARTAILKQVRNKNGYEEKTNHMLQVT